MSSQTFKDKRAFISGSSRGIGRAMALGLAKEGCDILIHYRQQRSDAESLKQEVNALGRQAWLYQADLCDTSQSQTLVDAIKNDHQTLDIFIANAASTSFKALRDQKPGNVEKTLSLVIGSFLILVQGLHPLLKNREAQILTISGIDTVKYCPGHGLLAAAKAALETITKYLSVELAGDGIHAKCFNPGLVASDSTRFYMGNAFDDICHAANTIAPHGGFASPEQVAALALFLLKPETNWIGPQTFYADGGMSFMLPVLNLQKK